MAKSPTSECTARRYESIEEVEAWHAEFEDASAAGRFVVHCLDDSEAPREREADSSGLRGESASA